MKKFILAFLVVFVANLGCKKLDDGDKPCACSPVSEPPLTLIIKGTNGIDMLNPTTTGYFTAANIKLYYQNAGAEKQIIFRVGQPFIYGNGAAEKFEFYQLQSSELLRLAASANIPEFYLKLGNGTPLLLKVTVQAGTAKVSALTVNNVAAIAETGDVKKLNPNIFYFTAS